MGLYPLLFTPVMKERVWGGRALERFGYDLQDGPIGEAWTIGDHPHGTTIVANGHMKGMSLNDIRRQYGADVMGSRGIAADNGRFPLLIKFLDCQDDLSIQVHPDDHYEKLAVGELGKTEMWYVLEAKPEASIIFGLKSGTDRGQFAKAIDEKRIMDVLQEVPVRAGDSFYIPAGTVHALKAGVIVAEIQQNSDTTYRVYDYDRLGLDGKPRDLHIEDSLNVTDYGISRATRRTTDIEHAATWLTLAESPYFITEKALVGDTPWHLHTSPESFTILIVCDGDGKITWGGTRGGTGEESLQLRAGNSILIPANLGEYTLQGKMTVLRSRLP